jgi:hypothetical protein
VTAAALVLRWGSYLAVLLDRDKPAWSGPRGKMSRISDGEMARINIEASGGACLETATDLENRARFLTRTDLTNAKIDRGEKWVP